MSESITQAAQILVQRRLHGSDGPPLPEACKPLTLEQALAVQTEVTHRIIEGGDRVSGWKCVLPEQDRVSVAPIYQSQTWQHGPCSLYALEGTAAIEPEFGFVLARNLMPGDGPFAADAVKSALGGVHLAFELIKGRFSQPEQCNQLELLADGLFNQGLLLGPRIEAWPSAQCELTLEYQDVQQTWRGAHPNLEPFAPVVWLVNYLTERGVTLAAGSVIITGSYGGVLKVPFDTPVSVTYGTYGRLAATFTEKRSA